MSLVDFFSKFAQLIPMDSKNLIDVKNALTQFFTTFGTPKLIVTDHKTTFKLIQMKHFLSSLNIEIELFGIQRSG